MGKKYVKNKKLNSQIKKYMTLFFILSFYNFFILDKKKSQELINYFFIYEEN
jgi:hypothetical protein